MSTLEISHYWVEQLIAIIQLIVDFGLVVLIWIVQLIIYPSLLYYKSKNLMVWHQKYTERIAVIVVPLMLIQLAIAIYLVFYQFDITNSIRLIIVLFLWIFTFTSFAPLHFKISEGKHNDKLLELLIKRNWWRTFLWSAMFVFDLLYSIKYFEIQL
tara:strand:- start:12784 stop:13251 length:468 start_codon:yes stop_codon:yes gene_type:complete